MYDELVKRLRASCESCKLWDGEKCCLKGECSAQTRLQAADAIEELSSFVRQIEELRKDGYYLQKSKMMTYGQATMTMPLPEPPKEAGT